MSVRLIVDSSADLRDDLAGRVIAIPLTILFGDEEYVDGVTINHRQFYERLAAGGEMPTTSQATPEAFAREFQRAKSAGDEAVVLTISSKLSGTCQSAHIAAQDFDNVHIVDSLNVALGSGILAEYALQLIDRGLNAADVARELTEARSRVRLLAMVDTLDYLQRGGRISKTVAVAGTLLGIKPVIHISGGEVGILGKARGVKQAGSLMAKEILSDGLDADRPFRLGYTGTSDVQLQRFIRDNAALFPGDPDAFPITIVSGVVGVHAGPGAVALAYFAG